MTEFAEDLRHHCRNPRCRMKLTAPAGNPHKAFCTRGCHSSFYLKRCLVCENDKPAGSTARRKLCRRPKCEGRYRKNSAHYSFLGADTTSAANVPRSAQSTGIKSAGLDDRPWTTDPGISLLARKSLPRSIIVRRCRPIPIWPRASMHPVIGVASAKRLLGPSPGRPLRRKCNRIGGRARQALRSRTISASPTFSNASWRPFPSHQRAFWSQPNNSASPAAHNFSVARQPRLRRLPAQRGSSRLSGVRRRRPAPWLIPGQAGSDRSDYGREYLNVITAAST